MIYYNKYITIEYFYYNKEIILIICITLNNILRKLYTNDLL